MIHCREFADLVTAHLEQELSLSHRASMRLHAAICTNCSQYLAQMQLTVEELGQLREGTPDAATKQRLLVAFRAHKKA